MDQSKVQELLNDIENQARAAVHEWYVAHDDAQVDATKMLGGAQ